MAKAPILLYLVLLSYYVYTLSLPVEMLQLMEPEKFHYLSQSGCVSDPTINDVRDFANVRTYT